MIRKYISGPAIAASLKTQLLPLLAIICCLCVSTGDAQEAAPPVAVSVTTPRRGTFASMKNYRGHLQPDNEVNVFANVSGKIVALEANVGKQVSKGAVLARSSSEEASLALIRAEAALSQAKSQFTTIEATAQAQIESQLATAQEVLIAAQAQLVETKSLAEMRIRNQLTQAESAYQGAETAIQRSKINADQALERAKAELDKNTLDFERTKSLHEKKYVSDTDFEAAAQRLKVAQTRHEEALATAEQFKADVTYPSVEKAKAELAVAQKLVESRSWEREIASAESKLSQAKASLSTTQKLVEARAWEHNIDIARSAVKQAEEQLKLAQAQLSNTTIRSPINGVIATHRLNVGDYAQPASHPSGKAVFTVIAVDVLKAVWNVPAGDARHLKNGDLALISTDSGIRNIAATISFISPTINRDDNTVLLHATVPNTVGALPDKHTLKPGSPVTVSIVSSVRKNVQLLPLPSVLQIQNGSGTIFVIEENTARARRVNVGPIHGTEIEVTPRLANGLLVIIDEQHRLQDGTRVSTSKE